MIQLNSTIKIITDEKNESNISVSMEDPDKDKTIIKANIYYDDK